MNSEFNTHVWKADLVARDNRQQMQEFVTQERLARCAQTAKPGVFGRAIAALFKQRRVAAEHKHGRQSPAGALSNTVR